jgi:hypothetical protein
MVARVTMVTLHEARSTSSSMEKRRPEGGGPAGFITGQARNTPPRILLNFVPPPDWDALNPIMNDILAMHNPYPAYNPPSATPEGLAPLVDITSYPICAGQFTMHPDYSVTLQNGEGGDYHDMQSVRCKKVVYSKMSSSDAK